MMTLLGCSEDMLYAVIGLTLVSTLMTLAVKVVDPRAGVCYDGFKRYCYVSSTFWQLVVLPTCILLMFSSIPSSLSELDDWAKRGRRHFGSVPTYYIAALIAAQLRDFLMDPVSLWQSKKILIHHVLVVVTSFYAEHLEQGYGNFVLSSYALEFGSACFNLCSVFPWSRFCWYAYHASIALSHVLAVSGFIAALRYEELSVSVRVFFAIAGVGVIIGRQLVSQFWWQKGFQYHLDHIHDDYSKKE